MFLQLGLEHITDLRGYDHILFLAALAAPRLHQPRQLFWLVTAFTLGHSLTLALSTYRLVEVSPALVEFIIPCTILITCLLNLRLVYLWQESPMGTRQQFFGFVLVTVFGLVHGLGFSSYLKALLGHTDSIFTELLAFNLGVEVGQVVLVLGFWVIGRIFTRYALLTTRGWNLAISSPACVLALWLMLTRMI